MVMSTIKEKPSFDQEILHKEVGQWPDAKKQYKAN